LSAARRDIGVLCEESTVAVLYLELIPGTVQNPRRAVKAFRHRNTAPGALENAKRPGLR